MIKINKVILTYIGIGEKQVRKDEQFSIEITAEELNRIKSFPYPQCLTGKVVRVGNKSKWKIDDIGHIFCNPFYDFHHYHKAGWKVQTCICPGTFHDDCCPLRVN